MLVMPIKTGCILHLLCPSLSGFMALGTIKRFYSMLTMLVKTECLFKPTLHSLCGFTAFSTVKWLYSMLAIPNKTEYLFELTLHSLCPSPSRFIQHYKTVLSMPIETECLLVPTLHYPTVFTAFRGLIKLYLISICTRFAEHLNVERIKHQILQINVKL